MAEKTVEQQLRTILGRRPTPEEIILGFDKGTDAVIEADRASIRAAEREKALGAVKLIDRAAIRASERGKALDAVKFAEAEVEKLGAQLDRIRAALTLTGLEQLVDIAAREGEAKLAAVVSRLGEG